MPFEKPRQIAVDTLSRHRGSGSFIEDKLGRVLDENDLKSHDRRLLQEIVLGCIRWRATLDHLIDQRIEHRDLKERLRVVLRVGVYQLFWLDRIPDHAIAHETVELARSSGFERHAGFVNAVMRNFIRDKFATRARLKELRRHEPALGWSHPQWLVDRWRTRFNDHDLGRLLKWNNTPPAAHARVNRLRTNPETLVELWRKENVAYDFLNFDWVPENTCFALHDLPALNRLDSFRKGFFYVQDPSTLLAVSLLDPQPGELILDLCSAPGGKLGIIAERLNHTGQIIACDLNESRLRLIRQNCERLGVAHATPYTQEELTNYEKNEGAPFDRVLLDAPCSNTGVMRRRVDLRWRVTADEITRLAGVQSDLLQQAARLTRSGGRLVYSTCSIEPEENEQQVERFLAAHPNFTLKEQRQLMPHVDGVDGAFAAVLEHAAQ